MSTDYVEINKMKVCSFCLDVELLIETTCSFRFLSLGQIKPERMQSSVVEEERREEAGA